MQSFDCRLSLSVRSLVQDLIGASAVQEDLVRQLTDRADGNPLFAEEMVHFLIERGLLRLQSGVPRSGEVGVVNAIPVTIQDLLSARIDRLSLGNRRLLQAAAAIGRRFDLRLLKVVLGNAEDIGEKLAEIQEFGLIRRSRRPNFYVFKHALVRDAVYQSLLSDGRAALHPRVAQEIERRGAGRIQERAEALAYHYSQTSDKRKAFIYLVLAGQKCLRVYSLEEATTHFSATRAILNENPDLASNYELADYIAAYSELLNMQLRLSDTIQLIDRYLGRIDSLGDDPRIVIVRHHYAFALLWSTRYLDAANVQRQTWLIANRLNDRRAKAYALAGEIHVPTFVAPKKLEELETLERDALGACKDSEDPSLIFESPSEALEYCERALNAAISPLERNGVINVKGGALILLKRTEEGAALLEAHRKLCASNGERYALLACDALLWISKIMLGEIGSGVRAIETAMLRERRIGNTNASDWYCGFLAEIYLKVTNGKEKLPVRVLLRNLLIIIRIRLNSFSRMRGWMSDVLTNPRYHASGFAVGRALMILGLFYQSKRRMNEAAQYLAEAKEILREFGPSPLLVRIDSALSALDCRPQVRRAPATPVARLGSEPICQEVDLRKTPPK